MGWLALGVAYSIVYAVIGAYLRPFPNILPWFRIVALLIPPLAGVTIIARRRHAWAGCQWLFWATLALGLLMSGISVVGWSVDEMLLGVGTSWLGWHAVFALFGGVAPLLALLSQPHRGPREKVTATIAVDIAGIAVLTGFLYSHFAVASDAGRGHAAPRARCCCSPSSSSFSSASGMGIAALFTPDREWKQVYRRLAIGLSISFITLSLGNAEIWQGFYQTASLGDAMWILPFAFYPWAAADAPRSNISPIEADEAQAATSRPGSFSRGLALLPLIDYGLRRAVPAGRIRAIPGSVDGGRDRLRAAAADGAAGGRARRAAAGRREAAAHGRGRRRSERAHRHRLARRAHSPRESRVLPGGRLRAGGSDGPVARCGHRRRIAAQSSKK